MISGSTAGTSSTASIARRPSSPATAARGAAHRRSDVAGGPLDRRDREGILGPRRRRDRGGDRRRPLLGVRGDDAPEVVPRPGGAEEERAAVAHLPRVDRRIARL